jgi:phenylacetate-coenzyme A ligase PaaK-like adenylate-forming protein
VEHINPYFDPEAETASPEKLREIQFRKLRKLLEVLFSHNPFYQEKFQKHGVGIEEIKSLEDNQRKNAPFGTNLSEPIKNFIRYHQTIVSLPNRLRNPHVA